MFRPDAFWLWDNSESAYTDETDNIRINSSINFLSDTNDKIYVGLDRRFTGLYVDLSTNGSYTGIAYEYFDGENWLKLSLIDSFAFNTSKYIRWNLPAIWAKYNFTSTSPHTATPPDTLERYWIRITCSAITTTAVISKIRCITFATYTTPVDISRFLQLKEDFNSSTVPTDIVVEDIIRRAEDRIDYVTYKSFRFNVSENEIVQYNRYGIFPRRRDLFKVYSVSIWNGSTWDALTEGRNNDYFVDYDRGMIYFTRLFLLPAAYGMTGRYFHFGFGEYAYSCQIDYAYGRDLEKHPEFYIVKNLATKIVARDILKTTDYTSLAVSGTDKVPFESKIRLLEEEIDKELEELKGVVSW